MGSLLHTTEPVVERGFVVQDILFIWVIVAMILFALAVTATPPDGVDHTEVFWIAVLATAWPFIVFLSLLGIAFTCLAALLKPR